MADSGQHSHLARAATSGSHAEARTLAEEILADLELNRIPLGNVAMKCARLARLMGNELALRWFQAEIGGYPNSIDQDLFQIALAIGRRVEGSEKEEGGPKVWVGSLPAIEANIETLRADLTSLVLPSLSEGSSQNPYSWPGAAISGVLNTVLQRRSAHLGQISRDTALLARIRSSMYQWVLEKYHLLRFGSVPTDAFQTAKSIVDTHLGRIAPDALQKFVAAQQRAISGAPEEWSQALLSLRRMLKDLADTLYPPRDEEIEGHSLDDEHYINRLWQFVKERATGDRAAILASEVQYIGQRIDALYELACKGTHEAVSRQEVDMAVIHVYLLVADLLSLLKFDELGRLTHEAVPPSGEDSATGGAKVDQGM